MLRNLIISEDGSPTLYVPELDEHYHSIHGAIRESNHIFIRECLLYSSLKKPVIFEVGFGTGLNAVLSFQAAIEHELMIDYITIEKYPLRKREWESLDYGSMLKSEVKKIFNIIHEGPWEVPIQVNPHFRIRKIKNDLKTFEFTFHPDLVYFDAFSPDTQPELWSEEILCRIHASMKSGGILTTYSVKGSVRRAFQACGFKVEKIKGPPGKRHMLRAVK